MRKPRRVAGGPGRAALRRRCRRGNQGGRAGSAARAGTVRVQLAGPGPAEPGCAVRRANNPRFCGTAIPSWRPGGVQSGGMNPFAAPPERWISPSLNRVRLAGDAIPAGLQGTTAYNILSTAALRRSIREAAPALRLPPDLSDGELLPALERSFTAPDPAVREAARALAGSYGRGLAYLLLSLHEAASLPAAGTGSGTAPAATRKPAPCVRRYARTGRSATGGSGRRSRVRSSAAGWSPAGSGRRCCRQRRPRWQGTATASRRSGWSWRPGRASWHSWVRRVAHPPAAVAPWPSISAPPR
jgi:hypothetical protein